MIIYKQSIQVKQLDLLFQTEISIPYYLIVNQDNQEEAFFCFEKAVKEGWG